MNIAMHNGTSYLVDDLLDRTSKGQKERNELREKIEKLRAGLQAVCDLIDNSIGVAGLHLNGDLAPWEELRSDGRFAEWLVDFDIAIEDMERKG